ncbi:MAG: peptidoglycan-binding protein [Chthonomonadales bacterium]|nr:peptidoglycan-binding protein [Chthonomonadales bacterium]
MGLTKAKIINEDTRETIECLFNPTEYTIAKANSWQPKPVVGKNVPKLDFTGGGSRTLDLELFFDVFEKKGADVRTYIDKLWKLTMIDESKKHPKTRRSRPPLCTFQWGGNWSFKAAITNLSVRYTLFRDDGKPVRAIAHVTMQEAEDDSEQRKTNPTSGSEPGRKRREVRPHDTLALISFEEYGDAKHWRRIAEENKIEDPLSLRPGMILSIPPLT